MVNELVSESLAESADFYEAAQVRSVWYSLLNAPFMRRPDAKFIEEFREEKVVAALSDLQAKQPASSLLAQGWEQMLAYLQAASLRDMEDLVQELGVERTRLYRGVLLQQEPAPPYEAVWLSERGEPGQTLLALQEFYQKHGYHLMETTRERVDYIGVQLAFQQQLLRSEATAWQAGKANEAYASLRGQMEFFEKHWGAWLLTFIDRAESVARTDFFLGHLTMLRGLYAQEESYLYLFGQPAG